MLPQLEAPWVLRRHCEDGSVKGTIGAVLTPQMPKQVWQSEDGKVFESEEECVARGEKKQRNLSAFLQRTDPRVGWLLRLRGERHELFD